MADGPAQKYEWLSAREHVLRRPETYTGAIAPCAVQTHVLRPTADGWSRQTLTVTFSPALLKFVDEVLTNACDNARRADDQRVIQAHFGSDGVFQVFNDGQTIPIERWPRTQRYQPEVLFGELMTGENFDDSAERTSGGRNGLGSKITGIFSEDYEVDLQNAGDNQIFYETTDEGRAALLSKKADGTAADHFREGAAVVRVGALAFAALDEAGKCTRDTLVLHRGHVYHNVGPLRYTQHFRDNLAVTDPPRLSKPSAKELRARSWTRITWKVDLHRLGMSAPLGEDVLAVLRTRVVDVAAVMGKRVAVSVDGQPIGVRSVRDYALALGGALVCRETHAAAGGVAALEVCVLRADAAHPACAVGFVNGIRCSAGKHVDFVWKRLLEQLSQAVAKRVKRAVVVKPADVREHLSIVIDLVAPNPTFTSQTKDRLDTPVERLGLQDFAFGAAAARGLEKHGVIDALVELQRRSDERSVQKTIKADRRRLSIPNYEEALRLRSKTAECNLYITEGQSAKALAVAGFGIIGRDHNGVFPLRGKLVNVHHMTPRKALENQEIKHLTQILGLDPNTTYTAELARALPYRHLVIFTDQDTDGAHIMGLVLNWLQTFYASLLAAAPDFVQRFATPIIRARVGAEQRMFFSQVEYEQWLAGRRPTHVKYFKGLGTSSTEDAKRYFRDIDAHCFPVRYTGAPCDEAVDLFFASNRTDDRKRVLAAADPSAYLRYGVDQLTYTDFLRTELVQHGVADNRRSHASVIDGLKPSQRKALYAALARPSNEEIRVAQFAAAVAEKTHYHHGEKSLVQVVVSMAQPWMGANNLALLKPNGMFGSRHNARTEHSAERYIYTERHPIARHIFPPADDAVLRFAEDDGHVVEPVHFVPVIPFLLCNGSDGIGTGFRSYCPAYAPRDVLANTRRIADDPSAALAPMTPSYTGFRGTVALDGADWVFTGVAHVESATVVCITELPPKTWTEPYIEWIRDHLIGDKPHQFVSAVENHSLMHTVKIIVRTKPGVDLTARNLVKDLKLSTKVPTQLLTFFDADERLVHFASADAIFRAHGAARRALYRERLDAQIARAEVEEQLARSKARFVDEVRDRALDPVGLTAAELVAELARRGYYARAGAEGGAAYDYLLKLSMAALTSDKSAALRTDADAQAARLTELRATQPEAAWRAELDALAAALDEYDAEQARVRCNDDDGAAAKTHKKKKRPRDADAQ